MEAIIVAIVLIAFLALSFFMTAAIVFGICWAFALTFSWKLAVGVWLILCLVRGIFSVTVNK